MKEIEEKLRKFANDNKIPYFIVKGFSNELLANQIRKDASIVYGQRHPYMIPFEDGGLGTYYDLDSIKRIDQYYLYFSQISFY